MSDHQPTILVIDDELPIRELLRRGLATQGYDIAEATTGRTAIEALSRVMPDLVILDLGVPDTAGGDLLRRIRADHETASILVLSSRDDEPTKVDALDSGADDYMTKPFGMNELLARIRAALRHRLIVRGDRPIFRVGDLSVDLIRRIVRFGSQDIRLSPREYELLRYFVHHAGKVITHAQLLHQMWTESTDPQYIRVYIRQLRVKIEPDCEQPRYILTELGVGYRLRAPD